MEPHRHYHGLIHIAHCLVYHDLAASEMDDPDAVEMAIWFHDIVCTPRARDNEKRSCELFNRMASRTLAMDFIDKVCSLIMATTHTELPKRNDHQLIVDIDLSSFGLPWDLYLVDTKAVRNEQSDVADANYYPANRRFLEYLLERPRIFSSDLFFRKYELFARNNISRYLGRLGSGDSLDERP